MTTVEVLVIDACPGARRALDSVRDALTARGDEDTTVALRVLRADGETEGLPFAGSPTILVDGADLFPSALRLDRLACRVYVTPEGLAPAPTPDQVGEALRRRLGAR